MSDEVTTSLLNATVRLCNSHSLDTVKMKFLGDNISQFDSYKRRHDLRFSPCVRMISLDACRFTKNMTGMSSLENVPLKRGTKFTSICWRLGAFVHYHIVLGRNTLNTTGNFC